ncbi:rod shape-determining protein MreD [Clostridium sp. MB40-C1]|uniref:rod shape-determining protein MreD n=1 Tax=Clostridium sp. MB40-C1 TaxID=3070996 RepID=UPI0027E04FB3|nr:rod shape-determining protein MreD [Clostridium sp. MB40-C1]WMJ81038.1 rod shape-determining protein MreD [Clostridium sp. MB40-C1]
MKKIVTLVLLSILFCILDNSLMPFLQVKGCYPSLLFVFVICYSIINDTWSGLILGVFSGLLQDIYLSNSLGINMLVNMLMCLLANKVGKSIFKDKFIVPVLSNFFISILKGLLVFVIFCILKQHMPIKFVLYTSIYNGIVALFMYKKVYKLCQKDFMIKNWRF